MPMNTVAPKVIVIPAKLELTERKRLHCQLRVAAYCRVSTDDEEQLTSYEAQQTYYTDKIMTNPEWTMAGIFADEGITGTKATKRPEFLKMIRKCKQKKIDLILVKSISRFARNTVDCLNYIRLLKSLGIAVQFEKEGINTLNEDSEMLTTIMGAFAQAESESISQNVKWGVRQAMREGRVYIRYKSLYAYEEDENGEPRLIESQAVVIRRINDEFLAGASLEMIKVGLETDKIPAPNGGAAWSIATIRNLLKNEKYCGDVLMQKTFTTDPISGKKMRNTGQLPMYLIQDHHPAAISRDTHNAVQAEFARRNSGKAPSTKAAPTGRSCYSAKYALTERLVCGECGTLYRRCVWNKRGQRRPVWRCNSRLDYGTKYCHKSPTIHEEPLKAAILDAINAVMSGKEVLLGQIEDAMRMELISLPGGTMSAGDIERKIKVLEAEFNELFESAREESNGFMKYTADFQRITNEIAELKDRKSYLLEQQQNDSAANKRISDAMELLNGHSAEITDWDENIIRQLVDSVKVLSADRVRICLRGGIEIERTVEKG